MVFWYACIAGYYYTNPGLGSPSEAVVTYCSKEQLKTCVYYDSSVRQSTCNVFLVFGFELDLGAVCVALLEEVK